MSIPFNIPAHFSVPVSLPPCVSSLRKSLWRPSNESNLVRFSEAHQATTAKCAEILIFVEELILTCGIHSHVRLLSRTLQPPAQLTFITPNEVFAIYCGYNDLTLIEISSAFVLMFIAPCLSVVSHTKSDLSVRCQLNVVVVPVVVCASQTCCSNVSQHWT